MSKSAKPLFNKLRWESISFKEVSFKPIYTRWLGQLQFNTYMVCKGGMPGYMSEKSGLMPGYMNEKFGLMPGYMNEKTLLPSLAVSYFPNHKRGCKSRNGC